MKRIIFVFVLVLTIIIFPAVIYAQTIESENYRIEVGRIGSGIISIPDASSENYQVDISYPGEEEEEEERRGGGGGGGGTIFISPPAEASVSVIEKVTPLVIPPVIFPLIPPLAPPVEEEIPEEEIPEQLFDISLEIDDSLIIDINDLTSRVVFTSFGTVPTPVDLTFTILDESRQIVYTTKDYIVVETEAVFTKKFEDIELAPGKYTLVLNTLYNVDVEDEFTQDFEIIKPAEKKVSVWRFFWFWVLILIVLALIIIVIKRKRFLKRL